MGVARKPAWWKVRIQELEKENKALEDAFQAAERKAEALEQEIRALNRELREQDRAWGARLDHVLASSPRTAEDNLSALAGGGDDADDQASETAALQAGVSAYQAWLNGGEMNEKHAPIHWAKDYMKPQAAEPEAEDGEAEVRD